MRPTALSSSDYMSHSGFNYSSTSPKNTPLSYKSFGYYFNSPKSDSQKNLTYSTRLKNESNRYSHKEKPLDSSMEKRSAKTREYSMTRSPGSLTYSGFYDNDKQNEDYKKSSIDFKPGQTYSHSNNLRLSASPLSRSTFIKEATREDANILTRKKYDIETTGSSHARSPAEVRPSTAKNSEAGNRWDDNTPKKGTVTYYPLEEFISKYSPNRNSNSNTTAAQNTRYASERERSVEANTRPLSQSRIVSNSPSRPATANLKYSMYESSTTSPYTTTGSSKYTGFFERNGTDIDSNNRSTQTSNFLASYEIKKYDYKNTYDTPSTNDRSSPLTRDESLRKSYAKPTDNDDYRRDPNYNRESYTNNYDRERTTSSFTPNSHSNSPPEKLSLDSFITRVDRNAMTQPFTRKFEEKDDYKSKYTGGKSVYSQVDERTHSPNSRESPFKASHEVLSKEPKFYKNETHKNAHDEYTNDVARWTGQKTRASTARNDESTDGSAEDDSPTRGSYTYYQTDLAKNLKKYDVRDPFSSIYREHFQQSFQAMKFCKYMTPPDARALAKKKVYLPKKDAHRNRKTLIFDLDETLIHCVDSPMKRSDVKLSIRFPTGEVIEAGINVRPYALEILKEMSQIFEVMVFTASHKSYANVVLDHLDPHKQYITHRLYRDSCIYTEEGVYVKDLRVIGNRNLQDMILVDNAAYSFGFQIENGVPCIPFYDNKSDQELKHLIPYLKKLNQARDIREVNKKTFKFADYSRYNSPDELMRNVIFRD